MGLEPGTKTDRRTEGEYVQIRYGCGTFPNRYPVPYHRIRNRMKEAGEGWQTLFNSLEPNKNPVC